MHSVKSRRVWGIAVQTKSRTLIYRPACNLIWPNSGFTSGCYSYWVCFRGICRNGWQDAVDRFKAFCLIMGDQVSNSNFLLGIRFQNYTDRGIRISGAATSVWLLDFWQNDPAQQPCTYCEEPVKFILQKAAMKLLQKTRPKGAI